MALTQVDYEFLAPVEGFRTRYEALFGETQLSHLVRQSFMQGAGQVGDGTFETFLQNFRLVLQEACVECDANSLAMLIALNDEITNFLNEPNVVCIPKPGDLR